MIKISVLVGPFQVKRLRAGFGINRWGKVMRRIICYFFAAGCCYCAGALTIAIGAPSIAIVLVSLGAFLLAVFLANKLKKSGPISLVLGLAAVILLIVGFIGSGVALKANPRTNQTASGK